MEAAPAASWRNATAQARDLRPSRVAGGDRIGEFFDALADHWRLIQAQRARLVPAVQAALDTGWTPQTWASATGKNVTGVRNPYAVLATRLSPAVMPGPAARLPRPPWCGECD
jgi:hypothetical protein